jgi:hypothetical protein
MTPNGSDSSLLDDDSSSAGSSSSSLNASPAPLNRQSAAMSGHLQNELNNLIQQQQRQFQQMPAAAQYEQILNQTMGFVYVLVS